MLEGWGWSVGGRKGGGGHERVGGIDLSEGWSGLGGEGS